MAELPFGFDKPEDSSGFLLWQTTIVWQRLIKKALEPYDISHAQFVIMALLLWLGARDYDTTQIMIVNWSKLDKMTVSKSLKKLASFGLVTRVEHQTDSRAKSISLTEQGKILIYKLIPIVEQIDSEFFSPLPPIDQRVLGHLLGKLTIDT